MGLAFARHGVPSPELEARVLAELEPRLPSGSDAENLELVRLLVFLQSDEVVRACDGSHPRRRRRAPAPLGRAREAQRHLRRSDRQDARGHAAHPRYRLRTGAAPGRQRLDARAQARVLHLLPARGGAPRRRELLGLPRGHPRGRGAGPHGRGGAQLRGPAGHVAPRGAAGEHHAAGGAGPRVDPRRGQRALGERLRGRDHAAGENLFHAASCSACHRFDGAGGAIPAQPRT